MVIKREAAPFGNCSKEWTDTGVKEDLTMKNGKKIPYTQGVGKFKTKIDIIFISFISSARETVSLRHLPGKLDVPTQGCTTCQIK